MTPETDQDTQISTEAIGQLTDTQRRELSILGMTIFEAKELDPKNPEHLSQVKSILEDCVYRGLNVQGRVWFSASEQVSPIFEMGLFQRESIINQLHTIRSNGDVLKFITAEEGDRIRQVTSLDANFSEADKLFQEIKDRSGVVSKFHQALFEESQLSPEARILKNSAELITEASEEDKQWLKYNMLYGNLMVNLALYQKVGISVEPKDVAALSEIWQETAVRDNRQADMIDRLKQIAKGLGLPEQHIEGYTKRVLEDINHALAGGKVTLEELRDSQIFAITTQDMIDESLEFEQSQENEVVYFSKEDLLRARSTIQKLREMFEHIDTLAEETKDIVYNTPEDDLINRYVDEEYVPFLSQLTPLELSLTYYQGLKEAELNDDNDYARLEDELEQSVPLETYLKTLTLLQASEFAVLETGEKVLEFEDEGKNLIYGEVKDHVLQCLLEDKLDDTLSYKGIINKLPIEILTEYLEIINLARLSDEQVEALIALDIQKWVSMAAAKGVHAEADPNKEDNINLNFEVDSEFIRGYFDRMPTEKQQEIAKKLQHIIQF